MSDVVDSVEASFKKLVLEKPYRSITVKEICEDSFISRRTFYANFVDKRAVLAYLFRRDCVRDIRRIIELLSADEAMSLAPEIIRRFYVGIHDNREFYSSLVKPMRWVDPTFTRVVIRALEKLLADIVGKYNPGAEKKLLAFTTTYHAAGIANSVEAWVYVNFDTPLDEMIEREALVLVPSLVALATPTSDPSAMCPMMRA